MSSSPWAVALFTVALLLAGLPAHAASVHVLAVGTNRGLPREAELAFAEEDAARYVETLRAFGGLAASRARVLRNAGATEVLDALAALSTRAGAEDVVHFYYSGHGDRSSLHLRGERLSLATLEAALARVPARVRIVILDACQSVGSTEKGLVPDAPFAIDLRGPSAVTGTVMLRAASEGETAQESTELRSAVFTHALLVGLRGAADVDDDGRVSLSELYRHAYRQTVLRSSASSGEVMHPTVDLDLAGAGELILTEVDAATARIIIPADRDRQYLLFARPSGALVAELWADPQRAVELPVAPGAYLVHRRGEGGAGARELRVDAEQRVSLEQGDFREVPLFILLEKGGRLRLLTHELNGGLGASYRLGLGQHGRLGWSYGSPRWRGGLGLRVGRSAYTGSQQAFETLEIDGELLLTYRWGAIDLSGGGFVRALQVRGTSREAARLGPSVPTDTLQWGAGLGPRLRGALEVLETGAWGFGLAATAGLLIAPERTASAETWTVRPELGVELGLRWELP